MPDNPDVRVQMVWHYLALARLGQRWSPERIAREVGVSPTTVKRDKRRIETGPSPVLLAERTPPPGERQDGARSRHVPVLAVVLAAAVLLLAASAAAALLIRSMHVVPAQSPQVTVCVRYGTGGVTGVAGGRCPPGWQTVTLTPGATP